MTARRRPAGLLLVAAIGVIAGGAVYLTQRVTCSRFPEVPVLGWGCDSDPAGLAIVVGLAAATISLVGWFQRGR